MKALTLTALLVLTALSGCAGYEFPAPEDGAHSDQEHGEHDDGGHAGHNESAMHGGMAGDHEQTGMHRPTFPPASGQVPSDEDASSLPQVSRMRFIGDVDLESSGYAVGNGTLEDPFVIQGYYVAGDLYVQDTDACVVIKENYIGGQLSLNWNAQCVHVHHNYIYDLRVNENIRRDGYATGGLLELNKIGYVGQLRHYDGELRHNEVGPMPARGPWDMVLETVPFDLFTDTRIANIDGFNQGLIHHNTFHGSVDLDFHGHHHGTGFFATHSHYHGDLDERKMPHDHTQRWTSVEFTDNAIIDEKGYGLRYDDRNHAGDDRMARSEQEETLDDAHLHRSDIVISRNKILGGLWIDIFNADDMNHHARNDGWLTIEDNVVEVEEREQPLPFFAARHQAFAGIQVMVAKEVNMSLRGNTLSFQERASSPTDLPWTGIVPAGIHIRDLHDAALHVEGNKASGFYYGLRAHDWDQVEWTMRDNDFGDAEEPVDRDDSVSDPQP